MSALDYVTSLDAELASLLPAGLERAVCSIPETAHFRFQMEADHLRQAGDARKREFVAGRECARNALARLGFAAGAIAADDQGVPIWPDRALAAISHSRGYCAAVAGRRCQYRMLGLDLEKTNRLSGAAIRRVVHPNERGYVREDQKEASLIFSAKEAFFKAQFPIWHTHGNFLDLELAVDPEAGELKAVNLAGQFPDELRSLLPEIRFRFTHLRDFVVTVCWLRLSG